MGLSKVQEKEFAKSLYIGGGLTQREEGNAEDHQHQHADSDDKGCRLMRK